MVATWIFYLTLSFALFSIGYGWGCYNTSKEIEPYLDIIEEHEARPQAMLDVGTGKDREWYPIVKSKQERNIIRFTIQIAPGVTVERLVDSTSVHKRVISLEDYQLEEVDRLLEYDDLLGRHERSEEHK